MLIFGDQKSNPICDDNVQPTYHQQRATPHHIIHHTTHHTPHTITPQHNNNEAMTIVKVGVCTLEMIVDIE